MRRYIIQLHFCAVALAVALLLALAACSRTDTASPAAGTVGAHELPLPGFIGDETYARVRAAAIPALNDDFLATLSRQGMSGRWDRRFDCNRFAALWIGLAQARYAVEQWHSKVAPQALALGEVWYRPDGAPPGTGHAIVAAVTDAGPLFIEPQTGAIVHLSASERRSIYFVRW